MWIGYFLYAVYVMATLWLMVGTALQLHLLWHARRKKNPVIKAVLQTLPFVTVQVPVYNEKYVIAGLLHCLETLDYPKDLFEVQVLDDSNDERNGEIGVRDATRLALRSQLECFEFFQSDCRSDSRD